MRLVDLLQHTAHEREQRRPVYLPDLLVPPYLHYPVDALGEECEAAVAGQTLHLGYWLVADGLGASVPIVVHYPRVDHATAAMIQYF